MGKMHKDFGEFCPNSAKAIAQIIYRMFLSETSRPREKHSGNLCAEIVCHIKTQKIPLQSSGIQSVEQVKKSSKVDG